MDKGAFASPSERERGERERRHENGKIGRFLRKYLATSYSKSLSLSVAPSNLSLPSHEKIGRLMEA